MSERAHIDIAQVRRLAVGACRVDLDLHEVVRDGVATRLSPKSAGMLEVLIHHAGRPVSKDMLVAELWRGENPSDDAIIQGIVELRRAFGDRPKAAGYIRTLPRVGYVLVAPVASLNGEGAAISSEAAAPQPSEVFLAPQRRPHTAWLVALLLTILATMVLATREPAPPRDVAVSIPDAGAALTPARVRVLTAALGRQMFPRLSPDGGLVAYAVQDEETKRSRLLLQSVRGNEPSVLLESDVRQFSYSAWSPDGSRIAYRVCEMTEPVTRCGIEVIPVTGGAPRWIGATGTSFVESFDWTADGSGLMLSSVPMADNPLGQVRVLGVDDGHLYLIDDGRKHPMDSIEPRMSPDGSRIAFRNGVMPHALVYEVDLRSRSLRPVTAFVGEFRGFDWSADGDGLVLTSAHAGTLGLFHLDLASGALTDLGVRHSKGVDVAQRAPVVAFELVKLRSRLVRWQPDGDGEVRYLTSVSTGNDYMGVESPDGNLLAFVSDRSGTQQVWLLDRDTNRLDRITDFGEGALHDLAWAPDGSALLVLMQTSRGSRVLEIASGSWRADELRLPVARLRSVAYGADAGQIVVVAEREGIWQVLRLTQDGGTRPRQTWFDLAAEALRRDADTGDVYAFSGPGRWAVRIGAEGADEEISLDLYAADWTVHAGEILSVGGRGHLLVRHADGRSSRHETAIPHTPYYFRMTRDSQGELIFPVQLSDDSDVGLVELGGRPTAFRSAAGVRRSAASAAPAGAAH